MLNSAAKEWCSLKLRSALEVRNSNVMEEEISSGKRFSTVGSSSRQKRSKGQRILDECGVGSLVGILSQSLISIEEDDSNIAIQRRLGEWKDYWYDEYDWLSFDRDQAQAFCKVCQACGSKGVFAVQGSINIQKSSWDDHEHSAEHKKRKLGFLVLHAQMDKAMATTRVRAEGSVMKLFYIAYWFGKENITFAKFPRICALLKCVGTDIPEKLYQCDKACASMIEHISKVISKRTLERIKKSPFYGIMVDESIDIEITFNLVIFVNFIENGQVQVCFLALVQCVEQNAEGYFKKSCKHRQTLKNLQIEFIDSKKMLKRFI
ncbi:hypothetical protein R1flu_019928 [Riccia fluitans]|uniref:C17orf113 probable zinc finger domain-containing protein n=1 Tax=Riccia fluitans TaxID=41844 RepID=A0ABD1ZLG9_9MARC